LRWQRQPPPQVPQVIGDDAQPEAHLVGNEKRGTAEQ